MRSERVYQSDVGGPQRAGGRADRRARRWATRLLCALAALMAAGVALAATAAAQQSDEGISLVALSVTSDVAQTKMTPAFDPDVTRYEVAAPSEGDMVTVNAVAPAGEGTVRNFV